MISQPHPTLPDFDYCKPVTLIEASNFLAEHAGTARPFLGGTDVFVRMRDGFIHPEFLVDVKHLDGTRSMMFDPEKGLTIGAAITMNQVIACREVASYYPVLAEACRSVASYQLRNRATIVGNICNASPAGDTIGACLLLEGVLQIHATTGFRQEPLSDFFLSPGKTTLKPGDIVTSIFLPIPSKHSVGTYLKLGRNQLSDLSIVGVSVLARPDNGMLSGYRFKVALASVAPVPLVVVNAEAFLSEQPVTNETIHHAAILASQASSPISDVRASAIYRKEMVRNLTEKALKLTWAELRKISEGGESGIS